MTTPHLRVLALLVPLASCGLGVGEVSSDQLAEAHGALTGATTYVEFARGAQGTCVRVSMPSSARADGTSPSIAEHCDDAMDTFDAAAVEAVMELDLQQLPASTSGLDSLGEQFVVVLRTLQARRATRTAFPPLVIWLLHTLGRGALTTPPIGDQRLPRPPPIPQHGGKTERSTVTYVLVGLCTVQKVTVVELCSVDADNLVSRCSHIATLRGPTTTVEPCSELSKILESRTVTYSVPGEWAGPAR